MSESFAERLSRFTPDGSGLDRDVLLFAAGRASAQSGRRWGALAGILAATQVLTLVLLWPRPAPPDVVPAVVTAPSTFNEPTESAPPDSAALWVLRERALATEGNLPPPGSPGRMVPSAPPLQAFGAPPAALLQ
jgi:hypothetical protein